MLGFLSTEWMFFGGFLLFMIIIVKFMNSQPKVDKSLEKQYKSLLTSEKYKVN